MNNVLLAYNHRPRKTRQPQRRSILRRSTTYNTLDSPMDKIGTRSLTKPSMQRRHSYDLFRGMSAYRNVNVDFSESISNDSMESQNSLLHTIDLVVPKNEQSRDLCYFVEYKHGEEIRRPLEAYSRNSLYGTDVLPIDVMNTRNSKDDGSDIGPLLLACSQSHLPDFPPGLEAPEHKMEWM